MSNRGQNLPFTPFRPLAWFLIGSFAFVLSFRALSFPLFTSLKRCLPFVRIPVGLLQKPHLRREIQRVSYIAPSFPVAFVLSPAFIPLVSPWHFDPVYFYFGTGEQLAEKFRYCSHLLWDVERLRLLMLRANLPNRAIVAILIPHNLARLIGFFEPVLSPSVRTLRRNSPLLQLRLSPICNPGYR